MIEAIKFVKGAVAKKDFVPNLTAFHIKGGMIKGYNGQLALCCPIPTDMEIAPNAGQFVKALSRCNDDDIKLTVSGSGKLIVRSGRIRVLVDAVEPDDFPQLVPTTQPYQLSGPLLECFKKLEPFIGTDASKPWSNGILLKGGSAYATNNVSIAQYWLGHECPDVMNIPSSAIKEILRVGEEPWAISKDENKLTLHYGDDKWLSTSLLSNEGPDLGAKLEELMQPAPEFNVDSLFEALEAILPFTDELERVHLSETEVSTHADLENARCVIDVSLPGANGIYSNKRLMALQGVATKLDLGAWPAPCSFYGENVRGILVGYAK